MVTPPKLADGLFHFEKSGKQLFLVPDRPDWIVVNTNGAILLFACDGTRGEDEIIASFDLNDRARLGAKKLFARARERGVLQSADRGGDTSLAPASRKPTGVTPLRTVHIEMSDGCNLRCKYCYAKCGKSSNMISAETLANVLGEVGAMTYAAEYVLSGGEPLLNPHTLDFAEKAVAAGDFVHLLTNGTLIDSDKIAKRIAAVAKLVKISIDGSTEAIHSITRGKGNFDRVIRGANLLIDVGANVTIAMVVTSKNKDDIAAMSERWGGRLNFQPLFPAGRGKGRSDLAISGGEYYGAMAAVRGVAPMARVGATLESLRGRGVKKCALADREISISATGDVYPCQLLHAPEFLAGNIRERPLREIYRESDALKRARGVTIDTLAKCSRCPIRLLCAGGCRARDYYEVGSIEDVGEFCEYEQLAFINALFDNSELADMASEERQ